MSRVKKEDTVMIISGKDRGKKAKSSRHSPRKKDNR